MLTDRGCPGCGLTRAVVLTVHGEFASGFSVHPAAGAILLLCLLGALLRGDILLRARMTTVHTRLLRWGHVVFASAVLAGWLRRFLD